MSWLNWSCPVKVPYRFSRTPPSTCSVQGAFGVMGDAGSPWCSTIRCSREAPIPPREVIHMVDDVLAESLPDPLHWSLRPIRYVHSHSNRYRLAKQGGSFAHRGNAPCAAQRAIRSSEAPAMRLLYTIALYGMMPCIWLCLAWRARRDWGHLRNLGERLGFGSTEGAGGSSCTQHRSERSRPRFLCSTSCWNETTDRSS